METDVDPGQPNSQKEGNLKKHSTDGLFGFKLYVLILCQISKRIEPEANGVDQEIAKGW